MTHSKETRHRHKEIVSSQYKKQRLRVLARDGHMCQLCGTTEEPFHIDHIIPRSKGGTSDLDNLQVLCKRCNLAKGSRSVFLSTPTTPPVFSEVISPRGQTSTVIYDDFGQIEPDDN